MLPSFETILQVNEEELQTSIRQSFAEKCPSPIAVIFTIFALTYIPDNMHILIR